MSSFWPSDLDVSDISSPLEILELANQEWKEKSSGELNLLIQEAEPVENIQTFYVYAKHGPSSQTAVLFSVLYRLNIPYPARIIPRETVLPNALKKSYYSPGLDTALKMNTAASLAANLKGKQVINERVCETPAEFRSELKKVFNLGSVKSEIVSLVSNNASSAELASDSEGNEDETEGYSDEVK